VGRLGYTAAQDVAKPVKEIPAGFGRRLRDMAEPQEAVDQPVVLYVLHLHTHIAQLLGESVALVAQWIAFRGREQGRR
jgi:hypothetical protein